jgi:hypothetical protein
MPFGIGGSYSKSKSKSESSSGALPMDIAKALGVTVEGYEKINEQYNKIFPMSIENRLKGSQGAFDLTQKNTPAMMQAISDTGGLAGNILTAGLRQGQNQALGLPVDYSAIKYTPQEFDTSALTEARMPEFNTEVEPTNMNVYRQNVLKAGRDFAKQTKREGQNQRMGRESYRQFGRESLRAKR